MVNKRKEHIIDGKRIGIYASKDDLDFYIPLIPTVVDKVENEIDIASPTFILPKSELSIYNDYHRLARCLIEYILYLFSFCFYVLKSLCRSLSCFIFF